MHEVKAIPNSRTPVGVLRKGLHHLLLTLMKGMAAGKLRHRKLPSPEENDVKNSGFLLLLL